MTASAHQNTRSQKLGNTTATATKIAKNPDSTPAEIEKLVGQGNSIDRQRAKHTNASVALLKKLSRSSDKATRRNVALNANTPKDVLLKLAPQFPGDFFKNPAFDWLLLEDPDLVFKVGQGVLKNILKRLECPESFMKWAVARGTDEDKLAVAMNPRASEEVLRKLVKQGGRPGEAAGNHEKLHRSVGLVDLNLAFMDAVKASLAELSADDAKSPWKRGVIGPHQWPWLNMGSKLAVQSIPLAACVPVLLPRYAEALASSKSDVLDVYLARDSSIPPRVRQRVLERMASSVDWQVREAAAKNSKTSITLLEALAIDKDEHVRRCVAQNPVSPKHLLKQLSKDTDSTVRKMVRARLAVGSHEDPPDWDALIKNSKADVRLAVAANPAAPPYVLAVLCANASLAVSRALAANPASSQAVCAKAFSRLIEDAGPKQLEAHANHPACPPHLRLRASALLFRQLVLNRRTSRRGRRAIPAIPDGEALIDFHRRECEVILVNPEASLIAQLLGSDHEKIFSIPDEQADTMAASPVKALRLLGLSHKKVSPDRIVRRVKSPEWAERMAIARNPATPVNLLGLLKNDPHRLISAQAHATAALKAEKSERQNAVLKLTTHPPVDLTALAKEVRMRLQKDCLAWLVFGTPWWNQLTLFQRFCSGSTDDVNSGIWEHSPRDSLARLTNELISCILLPQALVREFVAMPLIRDATLVNPSIPLDLMREMVTNPDTHLSLAQNPAAPVDILKELAVTKKFYAALARNPSTPTNVLSRLANDKSENNEHMRLLVAGNPNTLRSTSEQIFTQLAQSPNIAVRADVALSPAVPVAVLEAIVRNESAAEKETWERRVVRCVAFNPRSPAALLKKLAGDPGREVRHHVARNPATPLPLLMRLASDSEEYVQAAVATNPSTPWTVALTLFQSLVNGSSGGDMEMLARSPLMPLDMLGRLANDSDRAVRLALASNPVIPWNDLSRFSTDKDAWVREWATIRGQRCRYLESSIRNIRTSGVAAEYLLQASTVSLWAVRLCAIHSPSFPIEDRDRVLGILTREIEEAARIRSPRLHIDQLSVEDFLAPLTALGLIPDPSQAKSIAAAAKSKDWLVRAAAVFSQGIQPSLLRMLMDDDVEVVKQLAIHRLKEIEIESSSGGKKPEAKKKSRSTS